MVVLTVVLLLHLNVAFSMKSESLVFKQNPTNILLILADDLGYGDTSVAPFTGSGILTRELEKMASHGTIMSNFHTAAATCTPTRASILTGMYPWRMGIKAVYEYGEKGKSNRDDWLPQLPTVATAFRDANYSTIHSGKWHVGGMRNDDLDLRVLPYFEGEKINEERKCPHAGPNQQGFMNYVSVLDGPGAPRQNFLQQGDRLYSDGCDFLLHNDKKITGETFTPHITGTLSHCESTHAMRMMNDSVAQNKPFYTHVWFHAPHGPWAEIPGINNQFYEDMRMPTKDTAKPCSDTPKKKIPRYCYTMQGNHKNIIDRGLSQFSKYRSMVTDMDKNIGRLLANLKALGVERDTLVVFLSDNGPEGGAGKTGPYKGNKRFLYEGGIRVPAIFQWIGTIPAGKEIKTFGVSTDLYPTFLDAAGISAPITARLDGISLLPELIGKERVEKIMKRSVKLHENGISTPKTGLFHGKVEKKVEIVEKTDNFLKQYNQILNERVTLWHNDYEGPRKSALWTYNYKILLDEHEYPVEMFDMLTDAVEQNNLLEKISATKLKECVTQSLTQSYSVVANTAQLSTVLSPSSSSSSGNNNNNNNSNNNAVTNNTVINTNIINFPTKVVRKSKRLSGVPKLTVDQLLNDRSNPQVLISILTHLYKTLFEYAKHGDEGFRTYFERNRHRIYEFTINSDQHTYTSIYQHTSREKMNQQRKHLVSTDICDGNSIYGADGSGSGGGSGSGNNGGSRECSCEMKSGYQVLSLPFDDIDKEHLYLTPLRFLNGSLLLGM